MIALIIDKKKIYFIWKLQREAAAAAVKNPPSSPSKEEPMLTEEAFTSPQGVKPTKKEESVAMETDAPSEDPVQAPQAISEADPTL